MAWAHLDPGDVALVPDPGYPVYRSASLVAGADVVPVRLDPERGYLPDLAACEADPALARAKMLFLNYPNNPTGAVLAERDVPGLLAWCRERDVLLVHDMAYAEMTFDTYKSPSILAAVGAKDCAVEFYSLSKPYNMTGWRLAFCCGNSRALAALARLKSVIDSGQFGAIQVAGVKALLDTPAEVLDQMNSIYQGRRDLLWQGLEDLGLSCRKPSATFYLWAKVPAPADDLAFATALLEQAGVVVSPGSAFSARGRGHIRLALTLPEARLAEAVERISRLT